MSRAFGKGLFRPLPRTVFVVLLAAYLLLRLYMATLPGYVNDVDSYKRWALGTAAAGLENAYLTTGVDYPPLFLYILYGLGKFYLQLDPSASQAALPESALFTFMIKLPHLVFDLAIAALLFWLVGKLGTWGRRRHGPGWGRVAALLYLLNPAVLFGSAYWGQPDSVHTALALAALAALAVGATTTSGALLSAAGLMKPLAAPLVPLLALAAALRAGLRGVLTTAAGGLLVAVLVFLPFARDGKLAFVLRKVLLDVEAMPFTSVNGHNLWWIVGGWQSANAPFLGPLTPKQIGLALFLTLYAALLWRSAAWLRARELAPADVAWRLFLTAAAVTCGFFFLSTHMHENHLFMALPFLLAVCGRDRGLMGLAIGASIAVFLNMALHDPDLPYALPGFLSARAPVTDLHLARLYTWTQVIGMFLNSILVCAVTAGAVYRTWGIAVPQRIDP